MRWSLRLIRVKGIEIKVHVTFLLILIWAAFRWGMELNGGPKGAAYGIVVTLLLFACVTIHELAHSLIAIRFGGKVRGITLLPIGGISQMEEMPAKPRQELIMAVAGPFSNFVIAGLLIAASFLFGFPAWPSVGELTRVLGEPTWTGLISYMAMANIILGLFNLIPAYPMDGGRVLRALLALRMDQAKATAVAVNIGQGLAWLLGLAGALTGAWTLVIIAIFVFLGAGQEGRMIEFKSALEGLKVRQATARPIETLSSRDALTHVVDRILHSLQVDFPVVDDGVLVGFLPEIDLVAALREFGPQSAVAQAMRTDVVPADPDEPLFEAQQRMGRLRLRSLPVARAGRVEGLLTAQDVGEAFLFASLGPGLVKKS